MATKKGSEQRDEKINDVKQAMKENSDMIQWEEQRKLEWQWERTILLIRVVNSMK